MQYVKNIACRGGNYRNTGVAVARRVISLIGRNMLIACMCVYIYIYKYIQLFVQMKFFTNVAYLFNLSSFSIQFHALKPCKKACIHPNSSIIIFLLDKFLSILGIKNSDTKEAYCVNSKLQVTLCLMVSHEREKL